MVSSKGTDVKRRRGRDRHEEDPSDADAGPDLSDTFGDTADVKRSTSKAHYHFLLEFCHTHPGSHERKPAHWRGSVEVSQMPGGVGHEVPQTFLEFLASREGYGIKKGLENVRMLFERLGVLEDVPPVVLVGGTNGKGTVSAAIAESLATVGYRPGLYTSPHVERFLERIQVMGGDPDDKVLREACDHVVRVTRELDQEGVHPTYFEVATGLALEVFKRHEASVWVLEVGMGGRLDAVNVLDPAVSVITTVGTDHEEHLGTELAQRAREKAGIMRPEVPCFTAAQGVALATLREEAARLGTPLVPVVPGDSGIPPGEALRSLVRSALSDPRTVKVLPRLSGWAGSSLVLPRLPARQEMWRFPGGAHVLLDVAHNKEAFEALSKRLEADASTGRTLLVGLLGDKDPEVVTQIAGRFDHVVTTTPPSSRAMPAARLREVLLEAGLDGDKVVAQEDPLSALRSALRRTPRDGLLVVTGSFYLAGQVRPALSGVAQRV